MAAHAPRNSVASAIAANSVRSTSDGARVVAVTVEESDRYERDEPRDVQIEPVRQHELESRDQRSGQRGELQRRLAARDHGSGKRAEYDKSLDDLMWER